jgi:hypothetical protein
MILEDNQMKRKCLAIGIILLFVGVTIAPTINAQDNDKSILLDSIPITVFEYKSDGTVERTVVRMSSEQANSFHAEMRNTHDLDTRLSVYKKYNLISQDVTVDTLKAGMEEKAQRMGLTQDGLMPQFRGNRSLRLHVYRNIFCSVSGGEGDFDGFCFPPVSGARHIGMFFFITGGGDSYIESKGLLGEFYLDEYLFVKLVGFVGIIEIGIHHLLHRWIHYDGFCVYVKTLGVQD